MHELGIVYNIVERVLKVVSDNRLEKVNKIVLEVGERSGVVPKYLHACYPAAVDGTILEKTTLEIEEITATSVCHDCGKVFVTLENGGLCTACGSGNAKDLTGGEFTLKSIEAY